MAWSSHLENGCVPAEATPMPCRFARAMISLRSSVTSLRTSATLAQMPVPTSITDWCISGLTRSFKRSFPSSSISWTCERSSRVSGSMIWNSSSTPRVKAGRSRISALALRSTRSRRGRAPARRSVSGRDRSKGAGLFARRCRLRRFGRFLRRRPQLQGGRGLRPARDQIQPPGTRRRLRALMDPLDQPLRGMLKHPLEILCSDGGDVRVRSGIQEVDRVGHAIPDGELEGVEVVSQGVDELQAIAADACQQPGIDRVGSLHVAIRVRQPWVIPHDVNVLAADRVAAEVLVEDDLLLKRHDVLAGLAIRREKLFEVRHPIDVLPPAAGVRLEIRR